MNVDKVQILAEKARVSRDARAELPTLIMYDGETKIKERFPPNDKKGNPS